MSIRTIICFAINGKLFTTSLKCSNYKFCFILNVTHNNKIYLSSNIIIFIIMEKYKHTKTIYFQQFSSFNDFGNNNNGIEMSLSWIRINIIACICLHLSHRLTWEKQIVRTFDGRSAESKRMGTRRTNRDAK